MGTNNTPASAKGPSGEVEAGAPAPPKGIFAVAVVLMVCGLGVVASLFLNAIISVAPVATDTQAGKVAANAISKSEAMRQYDILMRRAILVMALSGVGALGALAGVQFWSRSRWMAHVKEREMLWRSKTAVLQVQLMESRTAAEALGNSQAEVREQLARITDQNTSLRADLEQVKRSERALSQQRQSLQSSKTVLELHVQERTETLQKLKHRYELILNSAGEGICGFDEEGKAAFVNPAVTRITGWPAEELLGKAEPELFCANGEPRRIDPMDGNANEQVLYRKDGSRFPVEVVRTRIEERGRQAGTVVILKDITERKRTEEALSQKANELARSNAELEQFAFVASHDLQEPLRKIQSFGDRLKTKCNGALDPEALDYLERMQSASARMRTLIDDLLAFSRVIRDSSPFGTVDLGQVTREVLGDLEVRTERSGGRVEVGDMPLIEADATQMRQLMLNLIGNALKFQPAGGKPVVKVNSRLFASMSGEEFCELTVQDNGIGFDDQYAEKIFTVFQRLHGRGEYEGTGVGLAVCRRITDRHRGTVVAKGELGKGATFTVTLPVRQPQPKAAL
jgi:PAS domain S-box-containing protein